MIYLPLALMYEPVPGLARLFAGTEKRYNGAASLQLRFEQHYRGGGQPSRTESGLLFLKKPGRMRWEYRHPEGKLFVSDGKFAWLYSPGMNQVEKTALKMSDDVRAPLAIEVRPEVSEVAGEIQLPHQKGERHPHVVRHL